MDVNNVIATNYTVDVKRSLSKTFGSRDKESIERYIKDLQNEYSGITLKTNDFNVRSTSGITITLSTDLIKKAVKDKEIDKKLKNTLKELYKDKNKLKSYSCSKDGHKVLAVDFFIDSREKISCSIKLNRHTALNANTKEKRMTISSMIEKQKRVLEKRKDFQSSLFYKYIDLLSKNKFKSIDLTV